MSDIKHNLSELIGEIPKEYYAIYVPKLTISEAVRNGLIDNKLSIKGACKLIEGMSYDHFSRVTYGENYNIDALLKILDFLELKIEIRKKE